MKTQMYDGPFYQYDLDLLNRTLVESKNASEKYNCSMFYAMKANHEGEILKSIRTNGLGVDCVSSGEIERALEEGWKNSQIVFAGSGKTLREISYALTHDIYMIHCESVEEFELLMSLKNQFNSLTSIALRINPDIRVNTHDKISTGERHHKFGMSFQEAFTLINEYPNHIKGLHFHMGSQIEEMQYFEDLSLKVRSLIDKLPSNYALEYLNLGGGLGIDYKNPERNSMPDFDGWMNAIRTHLPVSLIPTISLEPGRSIVGQCGKLVGQVQYVKQKESDNPMVILDVGMSELLRPALYDARHKISTLKEDLIEEAYTIHGPSCESSDHFGHAHRLPRLNRGDIVQIHSTGAYGSSMQLNYNLRKAPESRFITGRVRTELKIKVA
jgi:diaminopimelate decarboxylase